MFKKVINTINILAGLAFLLLCLLSAIIGMFDYFDYSTNFLGLFLYIFFPLFYLLGWFFNREYKKDKRIKRFHSISIFFYILSTLGILVYLVGNPYMLDEVAYIFGGIYIFNKSYDNRKSNNINILVELTYLMFFIIFVLLNFLLPYSAGGKIYGLNYTLNNLLNALLIIAILLVDNPIIKYYDRVMLSDNKEEVVEEKKTKKEKIIKEGE